MEEKTVRTVVELCQVLEDRTLPRVPRDDFGGDSEAIKEALEWFVGSCGAEQLALSKGAAPSEICEALRGIGEDRIAEMLSKQARVAAQEVVEAGLNLLQSRLENEAIAIS